MRETILVLVTMSETVAAAKLRTPDTCWDRDDLRKGVALMFQRGIAAELGRGEDTSGIEVNVTFIEGMLDTRCNTSSVPMGFKDGVDRACQRVRAEFGSK